MQLDAYEAERRQQEIDIERNEDMGAENEELGSIVPVNETQQEQVQWTHHPDHEQEQATPIDTTTQEEDDPNLFDILEEDVSDIGKDDMTEEEHVEDLTGEDDQDEKGFSRACHVLAGRLK